VSRQRPYLISARTPGRKRVSRPSMAVYGIGPEPGMAEPTDLVQDWVVLWTFTKGIRALLVAPHAAGPVVPIVRLAKLLPSISTRTLTRELRGSMRTGRNATCMKVADSMTLPLIGRQPSTEK